MSGFVHLHCHSYYSLLDAMASPEALVTRAKELGQPALALTDHGNLHGAFKFYNAAQEANVIPILGCEFYICPLATQKSKTRWHVTVLAISQTGWQNLLSLSNLSFSGDHFYYFPRIDNTLLAAHSEGLVLLSGCMQSPLSQFLGTPTPDYQGAKQLLRLWKDAFGERLFLEVPALRKTDANEHYILDLAKVSHETGIPPIITGDVHYLTSDQAEAHSYLTKIRGHGKWGWTSDEVWLKSEEEIWNTFVEGWQGSGLEKTWIVDGMKWPSRVVGMMSEYSPLAASSVAGILDARER